MACPGKSSTDTKSKGKDQTESAAPQAVPAADPSWAAWRGPNANGISAETAWKAEKITDEKSLVWSMKAGSGYSGISVNKNRVFTMGFSEKQDTVFCLNADDGSEVWKYSYVSKNGEYAGTRGTPVIFEGIVYTVGRSGIVTALKEDTGTLVWSYDLAQLTTSVPTWGYASSAVIYKDSILLNAGKAGVALNRKDGKVVWSSGQGTSGYSSPVLFPWKNETMALYFTKDGFHGVNADTGKEKWFFAWKTDYDVNAADPVIVTDKRIFISSGYDSGCALLELSDSGVKEVWRNKSMNNHYHTSMLYDGMLIGLDHPQDGRPTNIRALDPENGKELWNTLADVGALLIAGGKLLFISERGDLRISTISKTAATEIVKAKVGTSTIWTAPTLCDGRLYIRNDKGEVRCFDLR
jgi:outer membrane protein assembly factor BamB